MLARAVRAHGRIRNMAALSAASSSLFSTMNLPGVSPSPTSQQAFPSSSLSVSQPVWRCAASASAMPARHVSLFQTQQGLMTAELAPRQRRAEGMVTRASSSAAAAPAETFEYQAEVSRLMDLIVNSLYSNKEIFLRELVSNASDALDKLRFLSVTEPQLMEGEPDLAIRIKCDKDEGTVTISDSGIGMTREELVDSLGTIAQSGTAKFVQAMKDKQEAGSQSEDSNLIGQFGVGFYSAFLVADKVTVRTKSARSSAQLVWEARAKENSYTVAEETDPEKAISRGTSITLHLKPDLKFEYTDPFHIQNMVRNYSQFIAFPIYTWQERSRENEEEYEEVEKEGEEPVKKTKKVTERYWDWELANETKPIWVRSPKEVTKEEYSTFYKNTFKEFMDPAAYTAFSTEGEIEFKSLLYVPAMAPFDSNDLFSGRTKNIRLYVKRVFISDEFDGNLFPRYLSFVKGVVDSNDLPLNVSREILQESRIVRVMKKRLIRKTFDMLDEIAGRESKEDYEEFWKAFGKNIRLGCIEDSGNHDRLAPLLRFFSSKSENELISLDEYVGRMKEGQQSVYFFAADNVASAKSAPFLEALAKKDLEVLFLVDPIDEVAITNLAQYKDKKFVDISKDELDLGGEDDEEKEKEKEVESEYQLLCDWMKQNLGEKVSKVQVSKRLASSPCVLVAGKFGWSANMERIMKAQAMGDPQQMEFMRGRRVMEVNPTHPIIKELNALCQSSPNSDRSKQLVDLLYETAHLASGFTPENPSELGAKIYNLMAQAVTQGGSSSSPAPSAPATEVEVEASSSPSSTVVEASEVRTESDPWKN